MYAAAMFEIVRANAVAIVCFGTLVGVVFALFSMKTVVRVVVGIVLLVLGYFVFPYHRYLSSALTVGGLSSFATIMGMYVASYFPEEV